MEVTFTAALGEAPCVTDPAAATETFAGQTGVRVFTREPCRAAQEIVTWAAARGLGIDTIATRGPSLEDVFLSLTGGMRPPVVEHLDASR